LCVTTEIVHIEELAQQLDDAVVALRSATLPRGGLSLTAAATLARLQRSGSARLTELAAAEGVTQPSMTSLIARLADQGLVHRAADPNDGRAVVLTLTAAGEEVLAQRRAERTHRIAGPLADLSPDDVARIADAVPALTRLAGALRRSRTPVEVSR
jgi:DNA-binding MarR family transcriptional regulator